MSLLTGVSDFFGLDIGTSAVRLVELRGGGPVKQLVRYGYVPIDIKLSMSDARPDQQQVAQIITDLLVQAKVMSKNVVVGIPSQRVFTTVVDIDKVPDSELDRVIKFQADSIIPTAVDQSKIDWAAIGQSPKDQNKVEVLITSVPTDYVESRLDLLESIGLNVIAFEPDNLALARALVQPGVANPQMVVEVGENSTDIVVVMDGAPRLTRSIPTGASAIVKAAVQNLSIDAQQANQFVYKFGLSKDRLEGQIYNAVISTVDILTAEIDKSVKFFANRYQKQIERIIVGGSASIIPEMPAYIANKSGLNVEIGNSWRNVNAGSAQAADLTAVSPYFAVASGLAQREE
jgi:type IV pilus assembly protein PilM